MPEQFSLFDENLGPVSDVTVCSEAGEGRLRPKPGTTLVETDRAGSGDRVAAPALADDLVQIATKAELLDAVRTPALVCTRCGLSNSRTNVVFGEGNPEAPIVFVGEGPGENEDATGRPFVGRAGKLLDEVLRRNGMTRRHVYICNVLKCRAANLQGTRRLNRPPTTEEIGACNDWLTQQLGIIKPIVLVCVGGPSANTLIKKGFRMMSERGRWFNSTPYAPWAMAVLHPAYILRLDGPAYEAALETLVEDIGKARQKVIEVRREQKEAAAAPPPARSLFDLPAYLELLLQLQCIPGPSGDEGRIADFLESRCSEVPGASVRRVGDLLLVTRGKPRVAVFAHTDTIGFTQAYDRLLFPLGHPFVEGGERIRSVDGKHKGRIQVRQKDKATEWRLSGAKGAPGMRWVFAAPLKVKRDQVSGPYLDNRAGVWNAVRVLDRCENIAVVFSPGEEHTGHGASVGARLVYNDLGISRALISDVTWHTKWIKQGKGPAISLRDRVPPRQRFLEEVLAAAEESGLPYQREIEKDGGSDGSIIQRGAYPIDWVFIGPPEKRTHTPRESCKISDLWATVELYCALTRRF